MYSMKPGRGPSFMGGIVLIAVAIGGVFWTVSAVSNGAPPFFALFGIVFVLMAIGGAIYNFYNASQGKRFSNFDITQPGEEADPLNKLFGDRGSTRSARRPVPGESGTGGKRKPRKFEGDYCPFCRAKVEENFDYCPKCGKDI